MKKLLILLLLVPSLSWGFKVNGSGEEFDNSEIDWPMTITENTFVFNTPKSAEKNQSHFYKWTIDLNFNEPSYIAKNITQQSNIPQNFKTILYGLGKIRVRWDITDLGCYEILNHNTGKPLLHPYYIGVQLVDVCFNKDFLQKNQSKLTLTSKWCFPIKSKKDYMAFPKKDKPIKDCVGKSNENYIIIESDVISKTTFYALNKPKIIVEKEEQIIVKKQEPKIKLEDIVPASSGSGFFISNMGHVVTNYHVTESCNQVKIHFKGEEVEAIVLANDKMNDLSVLKTNLSIDQFFPLSKEDAGLLENIIIAGYPLGKNISASIKISRGIVSSLAGYGDNYSNFQTDAALNQGNSGGPVINPKGNVVGVAVANFGKKEGVESFNFGVKSSTLKSFLKSNSIDLAQPKDNEMATSELAKLATNATVYVECWMSLQAILEIIEKGESKKAFYPLN